MRYAASPPSNRWEAVRGGDWRALAEGVDAVDVVTPSPVHAELVRDALARDRERVLQVGHVFRFAPEAQATAAVLRKGGLGRIRCVHATFSSFKRPRSDGGRDRGSRALGPRGSARHRAPARSDRERSGPAKGTPVTSKIALSRIAIDEEIRARVLAFVDSGWYILGPESNAFERAQILSLPIFPTLTDAEADRVADAVAGVRRTREDDWVKRLSSRVGNGFRNAVTGVRVSDAGCTYRALRREALAECRCSTACTASCPRCSSSRAIA